VGLELAGKHALARLFRSFQEVLGITLLLTYPPDTAPHQEVVEDIGADVERIVLFEAAGQVRSVLAEDRPGEQHAQGLAADQSCADYALAHVQDVLQTEVARDERLHVRVARDDHLDQGIVDVPAAAGQVGPVFARSE